jgi:hypothetical protein
MKPALLFLFTILFSSLSFGGEGRVLLDRFLTETQTMSANFKQTMKARDGKWLQ